MVRVQSRTRIENQANAHRRQQRPQIAEAELKRGQGLELTFGDDEKRAGKGQRQPPFHARRERAAAHPQAQQQHPDRRRGIDEADFDGEALIGAAQQQIRKQADADRAADDQPAQSRADRGPRLAQRRQRNESQQHSRRQPAPEHQRRKRYRFARRARHHVIAAPKRGRGDQGQCPEGVRRSFHTRSADRSWRARCETCHGSSKRSA